MTADTFVSAEFDCCECGRHILVVSSPTPPEPRLCLSCTFVPGWFRDPALRAVIAPDHDGREVDHAGRTA